MYKDSKQVLVISDLTESYLLSHESSDLICFRVETQELSSHFGSLDCKLESVLSQIKLNFFLCFFSCKVVPNVVSALSTFVTRLLRSKHLVKEAFPSFNFTFFFHSQSIPQSNLTLLQQIYLLVLY